jgi:hypothetical protein
MYRSLAGIIEGWSKNLALGSKQAVPAWVAPAVPWVLGVLVIAFWVIPPVVLVLSLLGKVSGFATGWSLTATFVSVLFWMVTHFGFKIPMLHALLYPVGAIMTGFMFFRSAFRGEIVAWRGRRYRRDKAIS